MAQKKKAVRKAVITIKNGRVLLKMSKSEQKRIDTKKMKDMQKFEEIYPLTDAIWLHSSVRGGVISTSIEFSDGIDKSHVKAVIESLNDHLKRHTK